MASVRPARMLATLSVLAQAAAARACTVCDSPNGRQLRAGLFNGHFVHNFLRMAAPFPVFAAVVLLLHFGMPDLAVAEPETAIAASPEPELLR